MLIFCSDDEAAVPSVEENWQFHDGEGHPDTTDLLAGNNVRILSFYLEHFICELQNTCSPAKCCQTCQIQ